MRKRATREQANLILEQLQAWAEKGQDFDLTIEATSRDSKIPEGSLAVFLENPSAYNALAKASDKPEVLLPLLLAYQQYQRGQDR